jgi:hypothetical protein
MTFEVLIHQNMCVNQLCFQFYIFEYYTGARDGGSSRADITAYFMAKTARTQQGIARKQRPPGTGCLGRSQPTIKELSHTPITTINHTTTSISSTHPIMHISIIRKYKSSHLRLRLRITQTHTTKITHQRQSRKTSPISHIAESSI